MNPKFYLDQCVPARTVNLLRSAGFDAVWAGHISNRGWDDPDHLVFAYENGYTLITENREHFRLLHRLWTLLVDKHYISISHLGILTATASLRPTSWLGFVQRLVSSEESLSSTFFIWDDAIQSWQKF